MLKLFGILISAFVNRYYCHVSLDAHRMNALLQWRVHVHTLQYLRLVHLDRGRMICLIDVKLYDEMPSLLQENQVVKVLQTEHSFPAVVYIGFTNVLLRKVKVVVAGVSVSVRLQDICEVLVSIL
jgi:hypothetical protein